MSEIWREAVLAHHGILGMKWGVRRYQNTDGSLTAAGRKRYLNDDGSLTKKGEKELNESQKNVISIRNKNYNRLVELNDSDGGLETAIKQKASKETKAAIDKVKQLMRDYRKLQSKPGQDDDNMVDQIQSARDKALAKIGKDLGLDMSSNQESYVLNQLSELLQNYFDD